MNCVSYLRTQGGSVDHGYTAPVVNPLYSSSAAAYEPPMSSAAAEVSAYDAPPSTYAGAYDGRGSAYGGTSGGSAYDAPLESAYAAPAVKAPVKSSTFGFSKAFGGGQSTFSSEPASSAYGGDASTTVGSATNDEIERRERDLKKREKALADRGAFLTCYVLRDATFSSALRLSPITHACLCVWYQQRRRLPKTTVRRKIGRVRATPLCTWILKKRSPQSPKRR